MKLCSLLTQVSVSSAYRAIKEDKDVPKLSDIDQCLKQNHKRILIVKYEIVV